MVVHTVFFWLKDGSGANSRQQLTNDCLAMLGKIPGVRHIWAGPPAPTPKREVIDSSYDVGLTVVFDDMAGHDVYQEHPLHKEFLARHKPTWKRLQVYDIQ